MVFAHICELMLPVLRGPARAEIVEAAARLPRLTDALAVLAQGVSRHAFQSSQGPIRFAKLIDRYDGQTRAEGFHALHEWDGISADVNADPIPVDVLNYIAGLRSNDATDHRVLAILLDYYFLHVLSLMSLRIWDDGDANANLDRLQGLLDALQGPQGSGHRFASDAETLIFIATSHRERDARGFPLLLDRVRTLNRQHQLRIALGQAAGRGCHLRFGFETTYSRNPAVMRAENVTDYPWLRYAVTTLLSELDQRSTGVTDPSRAAIIEAVLGALTTDAAWFMTEPEFRERFDPLRDELLTAFEIYRPTDATYSPLALFFNSSHSVLKSAVVDAMLWGKPWPVTLNELMSSRVASDAAPLLSKRLALATTLMDYARKNPQRVLGKLVPAIVYDPPTGRRAFAAAMQALESPV